MFKRMQRATVPGTSVRWLFVAFLAAWLAMVLVLFTGAPWWVYWTAAAVAIASAVVSGQSRAGVPSAVWAERDDDPCDCPTCVGLRKRLD